jgi:hypothetical protein
MTEPLRYAFVDEYGGVQVFAEKEPFLVVAAVVISTPRILESLVKQARKQFGFKQELKAARSSEKVVRWILEGIVNTDSSIVVVALDKRAIVKPPKDRENLYRQAVARLASASVQRWARLDVTLDKRYTHGYLRQKLEWYIREEIASIGGRAVVIRQEDSRQVRALQVADYVAWAAGQKYVREHENYYQIIKPRIIAEEIIVAK